MVTRNDVARLAGVSPTVVSYVINNSNYVSAEKKKAVLDAIKQLGYIPNVNAKNLRQGRTNMIGVVRGSQLNDMFSSILLYLEQCATEHGYTAATISTQNNAPSSNFFATDAFVDTLIGRHFDAVFISNSAFTEAQLNRLAANTKVVLFVSRDYTNLDPSISLIIPEYREAVRDSIRKLIALGHRRISLLPNLSYPMSQQDTTNHRFAGYKDAFEENGMPIDFFYVPDRMETLDSLGDFLETMFHDPAGHNPPTAICTDEAYILARLMKLAKAQGIRIPQDLSLICFSSSTLVGLVTPEISSYGFSHHAFARLVIEMLLDLINENKVRRELIPLKFNEGATIAPPPSEN